MKVLPSSIREIRKSLSNEHFKSSLPKSLLYLFFDLILLALNSLAIYFLSSSLFVIPFILFQGSIFWSLFVVGHDCGHQSFSRLSKINNLVGFVLHHFLLVPYWGWKKSHHKHHSFHGNLTLDESHVPLSKDERNKLETSKFLSLPIRLFTAFTYLSGLVYPIYLHTGHIGKNQRPISHFFYNKEFFIPSDKKWVALGTLTYILSIILVIYLFMLAPTLVLTIYLLPLLFSYHLLVMITFLQHHFGESNWHYPKDWTFVKGALTTADYRYKFGSSVLSFLHHRIATHHLIHHLFPIIPHYNLVESTKELKEKFTLPTYLYTFSYKRYIRLIWNVGHVENFTPSKSSYQILDYSNNPLKDKEP